MKAYHDVVAFHEKFGLGISRTPHVPETSLLRMELIAEEFLEVLEAWEQDDVDHLAKELADLIYVCLGMAVEYGIPIDAVWDFVHESNMAKGGGARREDGKILKPEGWESPEPKIKAFLDSHR